MKRDNRNERTVTLEVTESARLLQNIYKRKLERMSFITNDIEKLLKRWAPILATAIIANVFVDLLLYWKIAELIKELAK